MDRLTEVLRQKDMEKLMQCVQQLLEYGAAVILLDLDETFMFRSSDRIDVVKNRQTCYHLYPEEYGEKLHKILGWEGHGSLEKQTGPCSGGDVVLRVSGLTFSGAAPLDLQISGGEIAFLRDENYSRTHEPPEYPSRFCSTDWLNHREELDRRAREDAERIEAEARAEEQKKMRQPFESVKAKQSTERNDGR